MTEIEFNKKCEEYGFEKTDKHTGFCFLHKTSIENIYISLFREREKELIVIFYLYKNYGNQKVITSTMFNSEDDFKLVLNNFNEECKNFQV